MKKVTIINKFGPASNAITGQNAKELADYLFAQDFEISFICLKGQYVSAKKEADLVLPYKVRKLRDSYTGRSPALRLISSLFDGFRLWFASIQSKSDAVVVMTDPPMLFFWFQLFRSFSKRKLFYWTMDLYPEAFVAGNYIKSSNPVYRFFHYIVYRRTPDLVIALGRQQLDYLRSKFKKPFTASIIPCGIIDGHNNLPVVARNGASKITFAYGGNIGEAHDAEFLISLARQLDPEKHQMIVSLYGSKAEHVKQLIAGNQSVHFKDFLNLADIASMDVNVASLLPEWHHICVPSKAVTAICCGSPLLLNAMPNADNWKMFSEAGWLIESGKDYDVELRKSIADITRSEIEAKKAKARELALLAVAEKKRSLAEVAAAI